MKKLLSILLTLVMVFSFASASAFADEETKGQITISPTTNGANYKVYQLFSLDTFDVTNSAYTYMIAENSPWLDFFTSDSVKKYFTIGTVDYTREDVTYNIITATDLYTETTAIDVAKAALEYAKVNNIPATAEATANSSSVVFENLDLGYYLVDTSVGALCGLTNTLPKADVSVKNYPPTLTKYVQEDDIKIGNPWGVSNDVSFGETVNFDVTINARVGAQNYIFHDEMEEGLSLIEESIVVKYAKFGESEGTDLVKDTHYTVNVGADDRSFDIQLSEGVCDYLKDNDTIVITYSAKAEVLNELDTDGILNKAWVTYGDYSALSTKNAETRTYSYGFDIVKTNESGAMLDGAEFALFTSRADAAAKDETKAVKLVKLADNSYRIATESETGTVTRIDVQLISGKSVARVIGLDDGTYYLSEIVKPVGYNELAAPREFSISDGNIFAGYDAEGQYDKVSGIHIENRTGASMPTTGGTGTMMFITVGTIIVLFAGVLLVTKKRMSMIED